MNKEIQICSEHLKNGKIIIYPTDTIWGIGCIATDPKTVQRIFDLKQREDGKALICLFKDWNQVKEYFHHLPVIPESLLNTVEPTTIILNSPKKIAPNIYGSLNSLAIRIPNHSFCQQLLEEVNVPIISTSANLSGKKTPITREEIQDNILAQVDYIVTLPSEKKEGTNKPSKIVKLHENGDIEVIRN
jgi:L-threonylcarbamoyladenylate synthase